MTRMVAELLLLRGIQHKYVLHTEDFFPVRSHTMMPPTKDHSLRTDLAFIRTSLACFGFALVLLQGDWGSWRGPTAGVSLILAILFAYRGRRGVWASP
jgi:hypothetical protein